MAAHDRMAAQLAYAVQPTLILMIMDAMVMALLYRFLSKALSFQKDGTPNKWRFTCTVVTTEFVKILGGRRELRMMSITYLLIQALKLLCALRSETGSICFIPSCSDICNCNHVVQPGSQSPPILTPPIFEKYEGER